MTGKTRGDQLRVRLDHFPGGEFAVPRALALYSASVALCDDDTMKHAINVALCTEVTQSQLYEIVLQSYLFLGFPRMLQAAACLSATTGLVHCDTAPLEVSGNEADEWSHRGVSLCKRVYDANYEKLKSRVETMAPEVFRWMVFEGYGKVLSRPGLDIVTRELSIIAFLMMENRPVQLHSHLRGAINVGTTPELLKLVVEDIGNLAGEGYTAACDIMAELRGQS